MNAFPIHVINLESRPSRRVKLIEEFKKHKIEGYNFVEGVDGRLLDMEEMKTSGLVECKRRVLKRGEIGCYFSHLGILRSILSSPDEMHMILEDDVYFVNGFKYKLNKIMKQVEGYEWDIFYLGINCNFEGCLEGEYVSEGIYYPSNPIWGTHGYLIKREVVERIIDSMLPMVLPIDVYLMYLLDVKKITLVNPIIRVNNNESDTQGII